MTEHNEIIAPVSPGSNPAVSPLDYLGTSAAGGDDATALYKGLKELNKMKTKKHKKLTFPGVILTVNKITSKDLRLKTGTPFVNTLPIKPGGFSVYEYKVFISELNSSLPIITKTQLDEYNKLKEKYASGINTGTGGKSINKKEFIRFKLYERIVNRFMSVYHVPEDGDSVGSPLMICKAEFVDENKMFFGKAISVT
tara:strand:- start:5891 stop:6481 length:591 start_codon:yes stop_codon:yes gene_type:complete